MKQFCRNSFLIVAGCLALASGVSVLAPTTLEAASIKENDKATSRLFQAVYADDLTSAQASVAEGANIDARDRWGMTPTDVAIDRSHFRIAHFLVSVRNGRRAQEGQAEPATKAAEPAAVPVAPAQSSANQSASASKAAASGGAGGKPSARAPGAASASTPASGPAADLLPLAAGAQPAPAWPAGKPNPFDPAVPAPGSQLRPQG